MATTANVQCSVSAETTQYVAALGFATEFARMLDHVEQTTPGLRSIRANLVHDPEGEDEPRVVIDATVNDSLNDPGHSIEWEWCAWQARQFTPNVSRHFVMLTTPEVAHER